MPESSSSFDIHAPNAFNISSAALTIILISSKYSNALFSPTLKSMDSCTSRIALLISDIKGCISFCSRNAIEEIVPFIYTLALLPSFDAA
jgi:hypothetical protein